MAPSKSLPPLTPLQQRWTTLYTTTLPQLAAAKSTVQGKGAEKGKWPVTVDHCFARIILDNAVGIDKPWPSAVAAPATRNMSQAQLKACVDLAEQVREGKADLWALDEHSLALRGKPAKGKGRTPLKDANSGKKRKAPSTPAKAEEDVISEDENAPPSTQRPSTFTNKSRKVEAGENWTTFSLLKSSAAGKTDALYPPVDEEEAEVLPDIRHIIETAADLTAFRRDALLLLTQVPRGRYTTYQALSDAMGKKKGKGKNEPGCARAIGMAMRTNPFAPTVPCHRVLASDGKVGGYKGSWGESGKFYSEKMRLLGEEGVKFDGNGKVVGEPFRGFVV